MLSSLQKKSVIKNILIATTKLLIAGIIIGCFHEYDKWLAVLLCLKLIIVLYLEIFKLVKKNWVLFLGMIITGICGVLAENWGIYNGFWTYHGLSGDRIFPFWLPFAWMFSFRFVYLLETKLIKSLQITSRNSKNILAFIIVAIFPVLGKVITIHLGVWTLFLALSILRSPFIYSLA